MLIKQRLVLCSQLETQFLNVNYQEYYLTVFKASEPEADICIQNDIYIQNDYNKKIQNYYNK